MHYYYRWAREKRVRGSRTSAELTRPASFGVPSCSYMYAEGRRRRTAADYYFIITAADINFNWRTLNYTPRRRCVCRELTAKFYIISLQRVCVRVCFLLARGGFCERDASYWGIRGAGKHTHRRFCRFSGTDRDKTNVVTLV